MTFDLQLVYSIISIACSLMASSYKFDLNKTNSPVLLDSPSRGLPEAAADVWSEQHAVPLDTSRERTEGKQLVTLAHRNGAVCTGCVRAAGHLAQFTGVHLW